MVRIVEPMGLNAPAALRLELKHLHGKAEAMELISPTQPGDPASNDGHRLPASGRAGFELSEFGSRKAENMLE
jgi:hypothetical protein